MSLYPQTPLSIGKVLDNGLSLYRSVFKTVLPLSFVVALLAQLPGLWPYFLKPGMGMGPGVGLLVGFVIWFVAYMAVYAGWLKSMDSLASGNAALSVGGAFSAGLPKVLPMLGASILFMIALTIGFVLLVIPGIILMISLLFFWFLIVLEDQGAIDSLRNSHALVWGNWWRTATILTVAGVIYMVAIFLVMGIAGAVVGLSMLGGPTPEQIASGPGAAVLIILGIQVVLNALLMPMMVSIMLVMFRDLQLRKSGSDLAARAATA
jgi:hypothetical protein